MLVNKCNFLQLSLKINAIFFNFLVQQKLALIITFRKNEDILGHAHLLTLTKAVSALKLNKINRITSSIVFNKLKIKNSL